MIFLLKAINPPLISPNEYGIFLYSGIFLLRISLFLAKSKVPSNGEIFNKSSEDLSKCILNSIKSENQEIYRSNIRKSKTKYTWSRFIKELGKV